MKSHALGLVTALLATTVAIGCKSSDDPSDDGGSTSAADDGNETETPATTSGAMDGSGTAAGSGSTGGPEPVDPTGDIPPTVDCGAGETLMGSVTINGDDDLAQLDGIAIVTGDLVVSGTTYANLDFLSCLTEVHGDIEIFDNSLLFDMSGTDNLTVVGRLPMNTPTPTNPNEWDDGKGTITITQNPSLGWVNGFNGISDIGGQGGAGDCSGAPAGVMCLAQESLVIRNNDGAVAVSGFTGLRNIYGSLVIQENDSIRDIDGLLGLQNIGSALLVQDNPMLCTSSVTAVGMGLITIGNMDQSNTQGNDDSC